MKLLVGLSNPGEKYTRTRHNLGAVVLDRICAGEGFTSFLYHKKFHGFLAHGMVGKWQVIALKPQTFMNKSGESVREVLSYYDIDTEDMLVLHDDIDLDTRQVKLKFGGSAGGHNGIRNVQDMISTDKFRRLKLGVGRPPDPQHGITEWVLGKFSEQDWTYRVGQTRDLTEKVGEFMRNTG